MKNIYIIAVLTLIYSNGFGQDSLKIEKLNLLQFETISQDILQEQARLSEQLKQLQNNATPSDKLREILKEANIAKFESSITNLSKRYTAGQDIVHHIIKETNSFNASFSLLVLQSQFGKLIDPTTYSEFNNALNSTLSVLGDRKPLPTVDDVNTLKTEIPGLNNPLVSTGLSIASYFLAKYHKKKNLDAKNFKSMTCVLTFTNDTKKDYDIISARLNSISKRLENFNKSSKNFFSDYLTEIGYNQGFDNEYPDNLSEITNLKSTFFNSIKSETANIGFIPYESSNDNKTSYQIEQVKFLMYEYELILLEIEGFIKSFDSFITKTQERGKSVCTNFDTETSEIFTQITAQLKVVQTNFKTVYIDNRIPISTKRGLFGFN